MNEGQKFIVQRSEFSVGPMEFKDGGEELTHEVRITALEGGSNANCVTWKLERAVRLELTNTGSAIRRLSRLATRARVSDML